MAKPEIKIRNEDRIRCQVKLSGIARQLADLSMYSELPTDATYSLIAEHTDAARSASEPFPGAGTTFGEP